MSKEHPILFSTAMVRTILDGKKTQTRRVVRNTTQHDPIDRWLAAGQEFRCPYGAPGDTLWVRETWAQNTISGDPFVFYRTDSDAVGPWRPSIFMPRWASRLTLRITEVRVERVQDISEDDVRAEGVSACFDCDAYIDLHRAGESHYDTSDYRALWDSINAKRGYGWDVNPWVWVVSFEVLP